MGSFSVNFVFPRTTFASTAHLHWTCYGFKGRSFIGLNQSGVITQTALCSKCERSRRDVRAFAKRRLVKKSKVDGGVLKADKSQLDGRNVVADGSAAGDKIVGDNNNVNRVDKSVSRKVNGVASRDSVLQACTITSGVIAILGIIIRQVSHVAYVEGLPIHDCSEEVSFSLQIWHLELILGLVILISSIRYILLNIWPDFAQSSEAANRQVLSSLQPLDYVVVAFLPGVSEELLFRGGLLPLFGDDWKSVFLVAAIFGVLHINGGRKNSFAFWATFVGVAYGYATVVSSSIFVPMISHALNNLIGGFLWRYSSRSSK